MKIYLDIYVVENFIVDMFLLTLTSNLIKKKIFNRNLILASLFGAIYSITIIIAKLKIFTIMPFQLLAAFIMNYIILYSSDFLTKLKSTIVYVVSALTLSGLCLALNQLGQGGGIKNRIIISNYSIKLLIIALIIIYIVYDRIFIYIKDRQIVSNLIYDIEIYINKREFKIKGFLDTGNELREPITNLPCIIVEKGYISGYDLKEENMYYVPYNTIGGNGKLKGFKGEKVRVKTNNSKWREIEAIICPCMEVLSKDREFNALLSRGVI